MLGCFVTQKLPGTFQGSLELLITGKGVLASKNSQNSQNRVLYNAAQCCTGAAKAEPS